MRVAFTLIRRKIWTGGYNYLINLLSALRAHEAARITPVLFYGTDLEDTELEPFAAIEGLEHVVTPALDQAQKSRSQVEALVVGQDASIQRLFDRHRIDLVFEVAQFYGWRVGRPVICWIPDLQHREMPYNFRRASYWKRELGFLAQTFSKRAIMLSSEDARRACERFYPHTHGRTRVVRFAVQAGSPLSADQTRLVAERYELPQHFFLLPNQFFKHKNHLLVLEALALLRARGRKCVVAVSGHQADSFSDQHFRSVKKARDEQGLQDEFRLLGMTPYADLRALMQGSAGLLNPSRYEGWSTSVEEARALGLPMVLSDLDVHREQAGTDALYFDRSSAASLADTLERFEPLSASERAVRSRAGRESAAQRVRQFSRDFVELIYQSAGRA